MASGITTFSTPAPSETEGEIASSSAIGYRPALTGTQRAMGLVPAALEVP